MSVSPCLRISVWSGPRNVSTALMYAFAQRRDTEAVDEPFYGHYLRVTGADHPGAAEVMEAMEGDAQKVITDLVLAPCDRPVLFLKNMAHHLIELNWDFLADLANVLLIRDPREMLPSLAQTLAVPALRDTGYKTQAELLDWLLALGQPPPVLDARELLLDPGRVLRQLCQQLTLPFDKAMLAWPAGPKPADGVWAKYWYQNVHASTGFVPYKPKQAAFPERLRPLLEECQPYYDRLLTYAIKAAD